MFSLGSTLNGEIRKTAHESEAIEKAGKRDKKKERPKDTDTDSRVHNKKIIMLTFNQSLMQFLKNLL